jgi:hypothetical protein
MQRTEEISQVLIQTRPIRPMVWFTEKSAQLMLAQAFVDRIEQIQDIITR